MITIQQIIADLKSKDPSVAYSAVQRLTAENQEPTLVDALIEALQHESPMVREGAAVALGKIKDPRAIAPLIAALGDSYDDYEWRVGVQASNALCEIGNPAIESLFQALQDANENVRYMAAQTLQRITSRGAQ
jgi:HEAT repeat protein